MNGLLDITQLLFSLGLTDPHGRFIVCFHLLFARVILITFWLGSLVIWHIIYIYMVGTVEIY